MAEEKYISKYDGTTTDKLLDVVNGSQTNFPFDNELIANSQHGLTNAAITKEINAIKDTAVNKGYFLTEAELRETYPITKEGSKAFVGNKYPYRIFLYTAAGWIDTGQTGGDEGFNAGGFYTKTEVDTQHSVINGEIARVAKGANYEVLDYENDAAYTRLKVLQANRKRGYTITYKKETLWVKEQYTSADTSAEEWIKDGNWNTEVSTSQILSVAQNAEKKAQEAMDKVDEAMAKVDYQHQITTEEQYEALETKDERTIYMITEEG